MWGWSGSSYGDEFVNLDRPHFRVFSAAKWRCPRNLIAMYQVVLLYLPRDDEMQVGGFG